MFAWVFAFLGVGAGGVCACVWVVVGHGLSHRPASSRLLLSGGWAFGAHTSVCGRWGVRAGLCAAGWAASMGGTWLSRPYSVALSPLRGVGREKREGWCARGVVNTRAHAEREGRDTGRAIVAWLGAGFGLVRAFWCVQSPSC